DSGSVLFSLINKQAIHLYLPALLLTPVLTTTELNNYQFVERKIKAILKSIPRDYREGNRLHTMISGLLSICTASKISSMEKIAIVEKILCKPEYELCIEKVNTAEQ